MCPQNRTRYSRDQIRVARRVRLAPLLLKRGFHLHPKGNGNMEVCEYPGLIVKDWYWNWPERDLCGNTIDYFENVLAWSFSKAMCEILSHHNSEEIALRQEHGYSDRNLDRSSANYPKSAQP